MRDDIAKVIVERPRRGGRSGKLSKQYRRQFDWKRLIEEGREDDSPARESMRFKFGWDRKQFDDFLSPILGFLKKSVGRPWDDVWSEISAHLTLASTTQRHVLGHVLDYVETNTLEWPDGEITDSRGRELGGFFRGSFYVCPSTGVLREAETRKRYRWSPTVNVPVVRFHRIDGVWFEVGFARAATIGSGWVVGSRFFATREKLDVWLGENSGIFRSLVEPADDYGIARDVLVDDVAQFGRTHVVKGAHWRDRGDLYCSWKRQAGKKEIRRFGLRELATDHGGPPAMVTDR